MPVAAGGAFVATEGVFFGAAVGDQECDHGLGLFLGLIAPLLADSQVFSRIHSLIIEETSPPPRQNVKLPDLIPISTGVVVPSYNKADRYYPLCVFRILIPRLTADYF